MNTKTWLTAIAILACSLQAVAQGPQEWLLGLSWSPEYCKANLGLKERQCQEEAYFELGGLRPRFVAGTEPSCEEGRLDSALMARAESTLANKTQLRKIWRNQGACSGLPPEEYLVQLDRARRRVAVPAEYQQVREKFSTTVVELKTAFMRENEGLTQDAIALRCRGRHLSELLFCVDADFRFQACDVDISDACRDPVQVRPVKRDRIVEAAE